jgi:hypothetical protein
MVINRIDQILTNRAFHVPASQRSGSQGGESPA